MKRFIHFIDGKRKANDITNGGYLFHENRETGKKCPHSGFMSKSYAMCPHFKPKRGMKFMCDHAAGPRASQMSKLNCKR